MVSSGPRSEAWCSGLTCSPVKAETAGSNPVASAVASCRQGVDAWRPQTKYPFGPWHYCHGPSVVFHNVGNDCSGQGRTCGGGCDAPGASNIGEKARQSPTRLVVVGALHSPALTDAPGGSCFRQEQSSYHCQMRVTWPFTTDWVRPHCETTACHPHVQLPECLTFREKLRL